jgi:hypothetical protein
MKLSLTLFVALLAVALLPLLVQASPAAIPEAQPAADALPNALPEAVPDSLDKRADKWCYVSTSDGNVNCRRGAGTGYAIVRKIGPSDWFGVRCKANGEYIFGNK